MDRRKNNNAEVLVSGAGPSGLMLACLLAHYKVPFRIIDKNKHPSVQSGAMILHARSLEYLHQLGLAHAVLKEGTLLNGISVSFSKDKRIRLLLNDKQLKLTEFPFICMLEQSKTERLLIGFLERSGHLIEWETELVSVVQSAGDVEAGLILGNGTADVVTVKYIAAADGGKSKMRELLQIPFEGKTHTSSLAVMECDANVDVPPGEALFSFTKGATTGFFPLPGARWRIDAAFRNVNRRLLPLTFEKVQAIFDRKTGMVANIRNASWFSVFYAHGKWAAHFASNRCFLLGDAAHLVTPVGGQGMNTGLQDACNLAWKLALVIKRKANPDILATYEQERKPVAVHTARWSDSFYKMAVPANTTAAAVYARLLPPVLNLFFRLLKTDKGAEFVFEKVSGISIAYDSNRINRELTDGFMASAPEPGKRLSYIPYKENGKEVSLNQKFQGDKFLLVVFGDRHNVDTLLKAVKPYKDVLTTEVIPFSRDTSQLYLHFGIMTQGWYLIRPDMHIASRWDGAGDVELNAYLHSLFPGNG